MDGKLVFGAPHDGTGRLVFGEQGGEVVPDAAFSIDADLPGLGALTLRAGAGVSVDADLPGLDGLALARMLRAQGFVAPLLAVTARSDADAETQVRAAGFDDFLRKPVSGAVLAQALEAALR